MSDTVSIKFRAECQYDVGVLLTLLPEHLPKGRMCYVTNWENSPGPSADVVVTVCTNMTPLELVGIMRKVPDSHCMIGTVAIEDRYTGERRS